MDETQIKDIGIEELRLKLVRILYKKLSPKSFDLIEDAVQEGIVRTLNKGFLISDQAFVPYVVRTAINYFIDELRKNKRILGIDPPDISFSHEEISIYTGIMFEELKSFLSHKCYSFLVHIYILGYTINELVPKFGPNSHAVSQLRQRCLKKARSILGVQWNLMK